MAALACRIHICGIAPDVSEEIPQLSSVSCPYLLLNRVIADNKTNNYPLSHLVIKSLAYNQMDILTD